MVDSAQGADTHYWYSDDAKTETGAHERSVAVLEAMRTYRAAESAMRRRTQVSMGMGENDLLALRYVIMAQQAGRSIGPKELTGYLGISSASTTVLLDRLERKGQLRREHSPFDRRALILVATATTDEEVRAALTASSDAKWPDIEFGKGLLASLDGIAQLADLLPPDVQAQVDYDDDPFGVQYWVLRWQW